MLDGKYKNIPWHYYLARNLNLLPVADKFSKVNYNTCGSAAISVLTGLNPQFIEKKLPKNRIHWTDSSLSFFLQNRGYKVIPVTKRGITNISGNSWCKYPLGENHCILANCRVCYEEASYFVVHKGLKYHNFEVTFIDPLFWLNKPTSTAFVVWHPNWA